MFPLSDTVEVKIYSGYHKFATMYLMVKQTVQSDFFAKHSSSNTRSDQRLKIAIRQKIPEWLRCELHEPGVNFDFSGTTNRTDTTYR